MHVNRTGSAAPPQVDPVLTGAYGNGTPVRPDLTQSLRSLVLGLLCGPDTWPLHGVGSRRPQCETICRAKRESLQPAKSGIGGGRDHPDLAHATRALTVDGREDVVERHRNHARAARTIRSEAGPGLPMPHSRAPPACIVATGAAMNADHAQVDKLPGLGRADGDRLKPTSESPHPATANRGSRAPA